MVWFWSICVAQKKTKDLTQTLQQAGDTMKLAAGAMGNDRRKHLEMSKPNYKVQLITSSVNTCNYNSYICMVNSYRILYAI